MTATSMASKMTTTSSTNIREGITFVDTGGWYALWAPNDANHIAALNWFTSYKGQLVTTDYIVDETLTLMKVRGNYNLALQLGKQFFGPQRSIVHRLTDEDFEAAWGVYERFRDKEWSFTDCTCRVFMERVGITQALTFDAHFQQFGMITVVP